MAVQLEYFKRFIFNYKFFIFRVLYFEILYSLRYLEFGSHLSTSKHKIATDTVPCVYYFLYKISKFIKKNKINNIIELGSGFGRVVNFLADNTNAKIIGFELDKKIFKKSVKLKNKKVTLFNKNILDLNFSKNQADCYIMIDPLKKEKDTIKLQRKIIDANKNKKKLYIIMVNINKKLINKKLKIINTINGNEDNSGAKGSITFLVNC